MICVGENGGLMASIDFDTRQTILSFEIAKARLHLIRIQDRDMRIRTSIQEKINELIKTREIFTEKQNNPLRIYLKDGKRNICYKLDA